jgi:hypothetical protein
MNRHNRGQDGFTLLELLIGLTLLMLLLIGMVSLFESNRATYVRGEWTMEVQQLARMAMGELTRQVRVAGYFPENFAVPPATPPLRNAVHLATDTALAVYGDLDGSAASNVFLYCWDGANLRRVRTAPGDAAGYTCDQGEILAGSVTALRFAYYDDEQNAIVDPTAVPYELDGQAAGALPDLDVLDQRGAVRRVTVTLTVTEDVPGQEPQVYDLAADIALRNVR